ncbi:nucleotidyltransferase [Pontibacillus yanchengensis]|uniref:Nucleotidyltransferase n=2 Tax=Pontibacillus yanchengensis TaxID=462910 RepID=A0ACC7VDV3_9BACI|nr:nucleotidyltransferase [Pontibacillus yanchengensis]MYL33031.1 nucleotidyltransferase [Pontibacillus yanchengensis]MYL52119.1 nucleotidyltransferase [Pontibacillus yanchengensis]
MKASGLIVEYNPFHYGHLYHLEQARLASEADCMIAVMSGDFLQRGEPAIIDKWHRAEIALRAGVDLVIELPYVYAVENSDLFAKGAVLTLDAMNIDSICFGSEIGDIKPFLQAYETLSTQTEQYNHILKEYLQEGNAFPQASRKAYEHIGLTTGAIDLSQPNNILGFSYVKTILDHKLNILPLTVQRKQSGYHDETINHKIASATSIRKSILQHNGLSEESRKSLPPESIEILQRYHDLTGTWHEWELYFPFIQYKINTMSFEDLKAIHGVEEGLEYRIKKTINSATTFEEWMKLLKSKRYTWTRLQRMISHLLTNTKKQEVENITKINQPPYVRILGMTETGKSYLHHIKSKIDVPLINQPQRGNHIYLDIEEKSIDSYYSVLHPNLKRNFRNREFKPPILPYHLDL